MKKVIIAVLLLLLVGLAGYLIGAKLVSDGVFIVEEDKALFEVTGKGTKGCLREAQSVLNARYGNDIKVGSLSMETGIPYITFTSPYSNTEHKINYQTTSYQGMEGWNGYANDDYWTQLYGWVTGEVLLNLYGKELEDGLQVYSNLFEESDFTSSCAAPGLFVQTLSYMDSHLRGSINMFNLLTVEEEEEEILTSLPVKVFWRKCIREDATDAIQNKSNIVSTLTLFVQNVYQIEDVIETLKNNRYEGEIEVYTVNKEVPLATLDYVLANLSEEEKSSLVKITLDGSYDTTNAENFEFEIGKLLAEKAGLDTETVAIQLFDSGIAYTEDREKQLEGIDELMEWYGREPSAVVYTFVETELDDITERLNKAHIGWKAINIKECEEEDRHLGFSELKEKHIQTRYSFTGE